MGTSTNIRPINDQVLVRQDKKRDRVGSGILYAPQGSEEWPNLAVVVAVGPGKPGPGPGGRIPVGVASGDRVLFKRKPASALIPDTREPGQREEFEDLLMLREEDILAVVEEG